ncbi:MAG TPA: hypothetical protein VKZ53_29315 [Candidatus Angelobacter sp.]|nr:hypothetical protein [Candidatus Angelobacter sp.]
MNPGRLFWPCATFALFGLFLLGCTVRTSEKTSDGNKKEDVDIRTPFGSLSVKTNNYDPKDAGLPAYPGARTKNSGDEDGSATVNISSSAFGLKVVALQFETDDSPKKVLDFYRKPLGQYGKVIQCETEKNDFEVEKYHDDSPVTCDEHGSTTSYTELKVGSNHNQHIVSVKPHGKGTQFSLVYVRTHGSKDVI